ncbi:Uncharacterised protein [Mycobacteroides abscessus subsp. abscessus]|nr:Uncharacterised protein [Mycobacteroides abscessus subsp. abscessus]
MAAATSATPACLSATRPPSAMVRSIQLVSAQAGSPRSTSGASSSSRMKLLLVAPPSMTTVVSSRARRRRARASLRSEP